MWETQNIRSYSLNMEIVDFSLYLLRSLWVCLSFISKSTKLLLKLALTSIPDSTSILSLLLQLWAPLSLRIINHIPVVTSKFPPLASFPSLGPQSELPYPQGFHR